MAFKFANETKMVQFVQKRRYDWLTVLAYLYLVWAIRVAYNEKFTCL